MWNFVKSKLIFPAKVGLALIASSGGYIAFKNSISSQFTKSIQAQEYKNAKVQIFQNLIFPLFSISALM